MLLLFNPPSTKVEGGIFEYSILSVRPSFCQSVCLPPPPNTCIDRGCGLLVDCLFHLDSSTVLFGVSEWRECVAHQCPVWSAQDGEGSANRGRRPHLAVQGRCLPFRSSLFLDEADT